VRSGGANGCRMLRVMSATDDLLHACDTRDLDAALAALVAGADPNAKSARGVPVLQVAIQRTWKKLVLQLVTAGADVNAIDSDGHTALHELAESLPDLALAALLLDRGAVIDQRDTSEIDGRSALHRAVLRAKLDFAGLLLDRGANIEIRESYRGNTPLLQLVASKSGQMSKTELANARWLIDRGADINGRNESGETPLHEAARTSREMTVHLLAKGAKITTTDRGWTPLFHAVYSTNARDTATWDALLAAGCDVNHVDMDGQTPLHIAQMCWNPTAVTYLLRNGADTAIKDSEGNTALDDAIRLKQDKLVKLLQAAAKPAKAAQAKKVAPKKKAPPRQR
jgi:ankyrin repeat protein